MAGCPVHGPLHRNILELLPTSTICRIISTSTYLLMMFMCPPCPNCSTPHGVPANTKQRQRVELPFAQTKSSTLHDVPVPTKQRVERVELPLAQTESSTSTSTVQRHEGEKRLRRRQEEQRRCWQAEDNHRCLVAKLKEHGDTLNDLAKIALACGFRDLHLSYSDYSTSLFDALQSGEESRQRSALEKSADCKKPLASDYKNSRRRGRSA